MTLQICSIDAVLLRLQVHSTHAMMHRQAVPQPACTNLCELDCPTQLLVTLFPYTLQRSRERLDLRERVVEVSSHWDRSGVLRKLAVLQMLYGMHLIHTMS